MAKASSDPKAVENVRELARGEGFVVVLVPEAPFSALCEVAKSRGMDVSEAFGRAIMAWVEANVRQSDR